MNDHDKSTPEDETPEDNEDANQVPPEAVPLTSSPDDATSPTVPETTLPSNASNDHSIPAVEFHPPPSSSTSPPSIDEQNKSPDVGSTSDSQHPNPVLFADIPPDNAALGEVQTDEDVELKPELKDGLTRRKKRGKYRESLQVLKPIRKKKLEKDMCPLDEVGLISFLTVSWMSPLFAKAAKRTLEFADLWRISHLDGGTANGIRFERLWKEELEKKGLEKASIIKVCFRFVQTRWIVGLLLLLTYMFAMFVISAVLVQRLLQYTEQPEANICYGLSLVAYILLLNILRITCDVFYWTFNLRTATRLRCGALTAVFQKVCNLRSLQDRSIGEIVNICTNDSQRLFEVVMFGNFIISSFALIIASIIAVVMLLGIAGLVGTLGTFMVLWPFQMLIGKLTAGLRQRCILVTDERVKKMNELLTYIKLIKMYAWEKPFARTIQGIRFREESLLVKAGYCMSWSITLAPITPNIATVITILVHVALGNSLTASEVFTLVAILNVLKFVIGPTPWAIRCIAEGVVAVRRLQSILMMEEIKPQKALPTDSTYAITINKGTFAWDKPKSIETSHQEEELVFTTNEDGSILCYPNGSVESLNRLHGEKTNGDVQHEDEDKYANPEEEPLQNKEDERKAKGVSWNGSVMVDGKDGADVIKMEDVQMMEDPTKGGPVEEKVVKTLFGIDLSLEKGHLTGICGSVGSGKSSLLSAILGNMHTLEGAIHVGGSFAYAAQEPWIYNATLEDNILFGKPMDKARYDDVLTRCSLKHDIEILPSGDQTEIGERGINLSGGQKQRVSLARALYADRDIYLLDDPLSAVDAHVGQHIFTECIKGALKEKTVLFVTHQLQYLKECDSIITIADGRIAERGHHEELMADDGEYARLINTHHQTEEEHRDIIKEIDSDEEDALLKPLMRQISDMSIQSSLSARGSTPNIAANDIEQGGDLMSEEFRQQGSVEWSTYRGYIKAGGYGWCFLMAVCYIIVVGSLTFNNWWLSYWINKEFRNGGAPQQTGTNESSVSDTTAPTYAPADDDDRQNLNNFDFYMMVYGCSLVAIIIFGGMKSMITMKTLLRASSNLHTSLFAKVMSSPMSFFDTTPTGRILNRFSKDLDELDVMLPLNMELFVQNFLIIIFALITISVILPWFLIAILPITILYIVILRYYRRAVRDMKRIENVSRSPWFSHISATVQGLSTIRAYNKNKEFADRFVTLLDDNSLPLIMFRLAARWAGIRLETLVTLVSTTTNVLVVLLHGKIPPALAGLAIAYAVQITGMLQLMVLMASETEARFTSAERIISYIKTLKSEAAAQVKGKQPAANWPKEGEVVIKDYSMRYREGLPLVLNKIDCHIKPKEKIGIVGRTGSGKSSLGVGLFRLVEPATGQICIDQLNINTMGLEDLRSKLSIIPQDPVLFIGTIRYNLDPFSKHTDIQLWQALDHTYMKEKVSKLEHKLEAPVVEGGDNFSVGERQLLCMARALLRNSKILMLDEATAAIDTETDSLIQATIREAFSDCTLLTIAHRLNTILDSDRVLLMDHGEIAEFDTPANLLANPESKFSKMLEAAKVNKKDLARFQQDDDDN